MALSLSFTSTEHGTGFINGTIVGTLSVNLSENTPGSVAGSWSYSASYQIPSYSGSFTVSGSLRSTSNTGSGDFPSWNLVLTSVMGPFTYTSGSGDLWKNENGTYELWLHFEASQPLSSDPQLPAFLLYSVFANRVIGVGEVPLTGTAGADVLVGTSAPETFLALGGNDRVDAAGGNDTVDGGTGNDSILGGSGDDQLIGGSGSDTMRGGTGDDTYTVDSAGDVVFEVQNPTTALILGGGRDGLAGIPGFIDTVKSAINYSIANVAYVENITLTGTASLAEGNPLDNRLTGNAGTDTLSGAGGDDTLDGGAGADRMAGGTGHDFYVRDAAGDIVTEALNAGTDTVQSALTYTLGANVERLTLTGTGHINGTGNGGVNTITGNAGNNILAGGGGADTLDGGAGNDTLVWDTLDASVRGAAGTDTLRVDGSAQTLNLLTVSSARIQDIEVINITGAGNNRLELSLQDVIDLSTSTDTLRVDGNAGDTVDRNGGWTEGTNQAIGANTYRTYTQGAATLLVDIDITSVV